MYLYTYKYTYIYIYITYTRTDRPPRAPIWTSAISRATGGDGQGPHGALQLQALQRLRARGNAGTSLESPMRFFGGKKIGKTEMESGKIKGKCQGKPSNDPDLCVLYTLIDRFKTGKLHGMTLVKLRNIITWRRKNHCQVGLPETKSMGFVWTSMVSNH